VRLPRHPRSGSALLAVLSIALVSAGASCDKKSGANPTDRPTELPALTDEPPADQKKPVDGAKLDGLDGEQTSTFETLVDQLPSPCGKAHSLRTSRNTDGGCVRSRFAVDFVVQLLKDGASEDEVKELYMHRYPRERKVQALQVSADVPHTGPDDAPVKLVEFFDYGCPACGQVAPVLEEVQAAFPRDLAIYYKQFPLAAHPDSPGAAQAALAAGKQGKYKEMHKLLFGNPYGHKKDKLDGYARQLGLDMAKFEADYKAAAAQVDADKKEGNAVGVQGTPSMFINGVLYEGPPVAKYMKMWIEEELAMNR
jgi:protein-disulfide isomerase